MTNDDKLVASYLRRLRRGARVLPRAARRELIDEITAHIAEARAVSPVSDVLAQLGDPGQIARAAASAEPAASYGRFGPPGQPGKLEITAVVFLLAGGFIGLVIGLFGAPLGWLAGAVMLWSSRRWQLSDKILGTLIWPGGLAGVAVLYVAGGQTCTSNSTTGTTCTGFAFPEWLGIPVGILTIIAPLVVATWLLHRARTPAPDPALTAPLTP